MAPRSRTGCLTCRQRKLKCTEERPVCAQCTKANRECIPSSGITFRHQQNPSMNGQQLGEGSLKSFYGYKETFGQGTVWVDIPKDLTFVHTNNPYDDEGGDTSHVDVMGVGMGAGGLQRVQEDGIDSALASGLASLAENASRFEENRRGNSNGNLEFELMQATYPSYATHGLEALSAVASQDHYNYAPPPGPMGHHDANAAHQSPHTSSPQNSNAIPAHNNLDYILNHGQNPNMPHEESNIDPALNSEVPTDGSAQQPQQTPALTQGSPSDGQQQPLAPPQGSPSNVRTPSYTPSIVRPSLRSKGSHRHEPVIADPELAFLMRDFSERAGLWMDLFDLNLFFATSVPVLAVRCPLLLYSCVALSAKSLARVDGRKPVMGGQISAGQQSKMETWPGEPLDPEGWVRKAREYYDLAVSLLRQALQGASRPPTFSLPDDISPETVRAAQGMPLPSTDSDELVAATAILCVYEFLDASGAEWSQHLDGAKSLFDIANDRMVPLALPTTPDSPSLTSHFSPYHNNNNNTNAYASKPLTPGRRAVFWNFARQDMLSAFINNTSTRLDTSDLLMWRNAGLKLTHEGFVRPSKPSHPQYEAANAMQDDMISNALIWLLMKLVNFIAAGDDVPEAFSPMGLGVRQRELLEYWEGLDEQLRTWYEGLPAGFHAVAVHTSSSSSTATRAGGGATVRVVREGEGEGEGEKWFPRPMCAATMQSYHFARIQLLHNKPHLSTAGPATVRVTQNAHNNISSPLGSGSGILSPPSITAPGTSLAARHASYLSILNKSRAHAREIVAIGLGRSDEATRIHSVQPLWTAGLVLGGDGDDNDDEFGAGDVARVKEVHRWRRTIVGLLRGVERDVGWASEYRVQNLLGVWGLAGDWGVDEDETMIDGAGGGEGGGGGFAGEGSAGELAGGGGGFADV